MDLPKDRSGPGRGGAGEWAETECLAGGATLPLIANRYRLRGSLGSGAFGEVLDAFDEDLHRPVAIKRLKPEVHLDPGSRARFMREARVLARLDHPNIVPLLDARLDDERPFLVMMRVDGVSLEARVAAEALTWSEAVRLTAEIAKGLGHAHGQGVLHRDIKPSNILCSKDGRVQIADFGLSSALFLTSLTASGAIVGTLHYMAPETLSGRWDERSDLYYLGAVLYQLIFHAHCFEAVDRRELIARILHEVPAHLSAPSPGVPGPLVALLGRALAKDPGLRPQNSRELLSDLEGLLATSRSDTAQLPQVSEVRISGDIERLEHELAELQRAASRSSCSLEAVLTPLSQFVREGVHLVGVLEREAGIDPDSSSGALVETVLAMLDNVVQLVGTSRWRGDVQGVLLKAERCIAAPLRSLRVAEISRSATAGAAASDFFSFDDVAPAASEPTYAWLEDLLGADDLARYRALSYLVGPARELVLSRLESSPMECAVVMRALWPLADLLLSEGRGRSKPIFELAVERTAEPRLREMWTRLYYSFKKPGEAYWDPVLVQATVAGYGEEDRRIFGRAFLSHPDESYRRLGLTFVQPSDLWYSITSEKTPLSWMLEVWRHLRRCAVHDDYFKIFFSCVRERLAEAVRGEPALVAELLRECVRIDAFLENQYFSRIADLNEQLRAADRPAGGAPDLESGFVAEMRGFLERPRRMDRPIEGWGSVPLPIQRLLARRGLFQRHFACHPEDLIALEILRHALVRDDVTEFLQLFAVNGRFLGEICKEGRFFHHEPAKLALVANPKTPAHVVLKHIGYLRQDSLLRLRDARDCNPLARTWATRALERRAGR